MKEFPEIDWVGVWGYVFVRTDLTAVKRRDLLQSQQRRDELYDDLMGDLDAAYARSGLAQLIREQRPDVIVDSINTATAISYQDVYTASVVARQVMQDVFERIDELTHTVKTLAPGPHASPYLLFEPTDRSLLHASDGSPGTEGDMESRSVALQAPAANPERAAVEA
jgi:hypothetical protein